MTNLSDIVERLRTSEPLPACPYDRLSPHYWTAPNDKPCTVCGGLNDPDAPDLCRGADTRVMGEAADEIERLRAALRSASRTAPSREIDADLMQRCKELIEWQKTGLLAGGKGGAVRALADKLREKVGDHYALSVAEKQTYDDAMRAILSLSETAASRTGEWQPIETAPRDGSRILATGGGIGPTVEIVSYNERVGAWYAPCDTLDDRDDEPDGYNRPSLWQPIPSVSLTGETGK